MPGRCGPRTAGTHLDLKRRRLRLRMPSARVGNVRTERQCREARVPTRVAHARARYGRRMGWAGLPAEAARRGLAAGQRCSGRWLFTHFRASNNLNSRATVKCSIWQKELVISVVEASRRSDTPLFSLGLLRRRRGTDCIDPGLRNQLRPAQLRDAVATPNSRSAVKRLVLRWGANALQRREEATLSDLSTLWRRSRRQTRPIHQRATRARRRTAAGQGLPSDNGAGRIPARPDPP